MGPPVAQKCKPVVRKEELAGGFSASVSGTGYAARNSAAGQFVNVYTHDGRNVPRPLGVCGTDGDTVSFICCCWGRYSGDQQP